MTPAARVQAAIDILQALDRTAQPADMFLRDWFAHRRYAGAKDRRNVAERVYGVLRHRASCAWRMGSTDARALLIASLLSDGMPPDALDALFSGAGYGPSPLTAEERTVIAAPPDASPPDDVTGEYPKWLEPELRRAFGANLMAEMAEMTKRAPVDLRVNALHAKRDDVVIGLQGLGMDARPTPYSPDGIRLESAVGLSALRNTAFVQNGAVEFQAEASQIASLLCGAAPGMRVLDLAAGAGGKSLALAARMENKGDILAYDVDPARLKQLAPRARRAGATIVRTTVRREGEAWGDGMFDVVLVDAPCSGSGTWRRNPETKWRLTSERLAQLQDTQAALLEDGARHTKPGGRLVYATCSVLPCENADRVEAFLKRNPAFAACSARQIWRDAGFPELPGFERYFQASPLKTGTDGFFAAVMTRN